MKNLNYITLFCSVFFLLFIMNSCSPEEESKNIVKEQVDSDEDYLDYESEDGDDYVASAPTYEESKRPRNGESPFDDCFGRGRYNNSTDYTIIFENRYSTDMVLLLMEHGTDEVIRNEYIRGNTEFDMTGIPYGRYYIQWVQGNSWSDEKPLKDCSGNFINNVSFGEDFNSYFDAIDFTDRQSYGEMRVWIETTYNSYGDGIEHISESSFGE